MSGRRPPIGTHFPATVSPPLDPPAPAAAGDGSDDRLLFWMTQGLLVGLLMAALLTLKTAVLDGIVGSHTATLMVLVRLAIYLFDVTLLACIYRRPFFRRLQGGRRFSAALAACLAVVAIDTTISPLVIRWVAPVGLSLSLRYPWLLMLHRIATCLTWSLAYHMLEQRAAVRQATRAATSARLEATEAELALRQSEITRLGQQIEPHFLFNALSAILACRHDPEAVESVTAALADYLRFCLSRSGGPEPLAHELDAIEQLLAVHEARFAGDLSCRVTSSPAARRVPVPPLLLGPLVDNALKYGGRTATGPRSVVVEARVRDDRLVVEVTNTGRWVEPDPARSGTGLANLRRRLELSGLEHRVALEPHDGSVTARVELPSKPPAAPAAGGSGGCHADSAAAAHGSVEHEAHA